MVRVQPDKFRDLLPDEVMESQYHQFGSSDGGSVHSERATPPPTGLRRIAVFVLYGVLLLLLLILLMVTGIKFSQLNKEVTEVKVQLERIIHGADAAAQDVYLEKLVPVRGSCQAGWVSFQRSCYLLSTAATSWSKAEEQCRAHGAHLLVLNGVDELDYISKIVEIQYNYWIGLVERQHEGHWSWVDGTDFNSTPTFWDVGQPDNWAFRESGEDCGQLHSSDKRKRKLWNDADCKLMCPYICEGRA